MVGLASTLSAFRMCSFIVPLPHSIFSDWTRTRTARTPFSPAVTCAIAFGAPSMTAFTSFALQVQLRIVDVPSTQSLLSGWSVSSLIGRPGDER